MVEGAVKNALGVKDKNKAEKKGGGGILSMFGGGKDKNEKDKVKEKGGQFGDDKKKDEDKGGFFSKVFDKDDNGAKGEQKKSGFNGLFTEGEGGGAVGGGGEGAVGGGGENQGAVVAVNDRDLLDDLSDVAAELAK
ncbi:eukaryotic translation initiation factor 4B1-like [Melanotaenia boesemani]|uniref:eukaryotic translation initiation factor 4B1-like n=1 Tax=Melanotaenia boesemani TaxID=1250792 RepID=UPI001C0555DD|nr:eukaryotic translation initiation factor 4B1-like [Melanotaenia boesemani]